jgi:hypothetical protein
MPRGVYDRNRGAAQAAPSTQPEIGVGPVTEVAPNEKTVAMELKRHYVPRNLRGIVGYQKEAIVRKGPDGRMMTVEEAAFIEGEAKPAVYPGSGFPNKIWAGTVIEVPESEAKDMRTKKIAEAYI